MLSRIISAAFFVPNGHLCVENGQQPGTEEGFHMIKKDFTQANWEKEDLWKCILLDVSIFMSQFTCGCLTAGRCEGLERYPAHQKQRIPVQVKELLVKNNKPQTSQWTQRNVSKGGSELLAYWSTNECPGWNSAQHSSLGWNLAFLALVTANRAACCTHAFKFKMASLEVQDGNGLSDYRETMWKQAIYKDGISRTQCTEDHKHKHLFAGRGELTPNFEFTCFRI